MIQQSIKIDDGKLQWKQCHSEWVRRHPDGRYIIQLRKEKSKATHPMFGYLFGYVYKELVVAAGGSANKLEIDYIHKQLKKRFGVEEIVEKPVFQGKKLVWIEERQPKSLADYTVEEMQNYWTELQRVGAEVWGLEIHDPDPEWRKKWYAWEQKRKKNKADYEKVKQHFDGVEV